MPSLFQGLLVALMFVAVWAFLRWRYPRPEYMPLETRADDPLLLAAMQTARERLPEFAALLAAPREDALVKPRFVSSTAQVEHLWAEVVEVLGPEKLGVRLVTPPVTHQGVLDRLHRCSFDDVEDWQVRAVGGKLHGGFTQRAMFAIARRDGVTLPKELAAQEAQYDDV